MTAHSAPAATPSRLRWLLLFGVWLVYGCFGLIAVSLSPLVQRIESDLGFSHAAMGSIMGVWQLVYIGAAVPCGLLLDRVLSRWSLLLGASLIAVSALGRSLATDYWTLLFAVGLFGIGGPIISAGAPKVIASWFEGKDRGLAMGIYMTGPALGGVAALTLTHSLLLPAFDNDWRPIFKLWAGLALGAGLLWWLLASHTKVRAHEVAQARDDAANSDARLGVRALLAIPGVQLVMLMSVGAFLFNHGLNNWLPEILRQGGMTLVQAGYWAAFPTLVGIVGSLVIPRLATPERRFGILLALFLIAAGASILLQFIAQPWLSLGLLLQGIARSAMMTVLILTLVELPGIGQRNAGAASGLFFSAAEIGGVLGPLGLGVIYQATGGFDWSLAMLCAVAFLLALAVGRLRRIAVG